MAGQFRLNQISLGSVQRFLSSLSVLMDGHIFFDALQGCEHAQKEGISVLCQA
jgi:hypothetical protein